MGKYCLDSSTIIWFLRGDKETIRVLDHIRKEGVPGCSSLSMYEVEVGIRKGEEETTRKFLDALHIYPVEASIARMAADYGRRYGKKGKKLTIIDALIASTCIIHDLILVTYDSDYFLMPELRLYPLKARS